MFDSIVKRTGSIPIVSRAALFSGRGTFFRGRGRTESVTPLGANNNRFWLSLLECEWVYMMQYTAVEGFVETSYCL